MALIDQQEAVQGVKELFSLGDCYCDEYSIVGMLNSLPTQEIIQCKDCKHNPKKEWFGCPMAHLNERQRPEDAWCWRGEREADGSSD